MDPAAIAQIARNFSAMVRVQGPDPRGLKMRRHAFHLHQDGTTTLSASGLLLPPGSLSETPPIIAHVCGACKHSGAVVVTSSSVVEPFLIAEHRSNPGQLFSPKLITSARIDVLCEVGKKGRGGEDVAGPNWQPSELLALMDVSASSVALESLLGAQNGSPENASWEVGWSLAPLTDGSHSIASQRQVGNDTVFTFETSRKYASDDSRNGTLMGQSAMRIAFLGIPSLDVKDMLHLDVSQPQKSGDLLLVMGSPFGILSPFHFFNSISVGVVANCCSQGPPPCSLLMADIRCLPGMEGGPVFNRHGCLAGILTRPIRQKGGSTEIQLVITWHAIATALGDGSRKKAQRPNKEPVGRDISSVQQEPLKIHHNGSTSLDCLSSSVVPFSSLQFSIEEALSSIVLITLDNGVWASGVLLNNQGLILTNAHLVEPWRFGKISNLGLMNDNNTLPAEHGRTPFKKEGNLGEEKTHILLPSQLGNSNGIVDNERAASLLNLGHKSCKLSVRLDHMKRQMWCDACVVYVSKGPFDVALLQLEQVPSQLCAVTPELDHPSAGINVHVIGHGLLGPRSGLGPSISSGVLARVVSIPIYSMSENEEISVPVMLQTTAAVHPGASGGAVFNSDGHMIGLVTSNAKHAGGATVPHLNFSISCAALRPIFMFSDKKDVSILQVLDKPNELLASVWALAPPASSQPQSSSQNKEGRGSRFARFLAEKESGLDPLRDQSHQFMDKFPKDVFQQSKM